jgi:hypothetical protein
VVLVNEVKNLCKTWRDYQVRHVNREMNGISHTLAKFGYTSQRTKVWFNHGDIIRMACIKDDTLMP